MDKGFSKKDMKSFNSFDCGICERTFKYKSQLTIHSRIHLGANPYKCDVCDKNFMLKSHLTTHKKFILKKSHTNVMCVIKVLY